MTAEIITKEDLQEFGKNLLNQIRGLLGQTIEEPKRWLKTYQVKNLLKISDNTLQTLRDNGTIPFTKIGGILYYNFDDINKVLSGEVKPKRIKVGTTYNLAEIDGKLSYKANGFLPKFVSLWVPLYNDPGKI
jgi:hypothetical protein